MSKEKFLDCNLEHGIQCYHFYIQAINSGLECTISHRIKKYITMEVQIRMHFWESEYQAT